MKNNSFRRMSKYDYYYYVNTTFRHSRLGLNNNTTRKIKKICRKTARKAINRTLLGW